MFVSDLNLLDGLERRSSSVIHCRPFVWLGKNPWSLRKKMSGFLAVGVRESVRLVDLALGRLS